MLLNYRGWRRLMEAASVYTTTGDPYEYRVDGGEWFTRGPGIPDWTSLADNTLATAKLDSRHPGVRLGPGAADAELLEPNSINRPSPEPVEPAPPPSQILVCSHAAAWDGSGGSRAENCLTNIEANLKADTYMIELDIQVTRDGIPVLFHDSTLDAKTNGSGRIQQLPWSEVKKISYSADSNQRIASLKEAVDLLKQYGSRSLLQLDKCDSSELSVIHQLGLLKGIESLIVAKGTSYSAPGIVGTMGIKWMSILPSSSVGRLTSKAAVDSVVSQISPGLFEYQFSDADSYIVNGYMSTQLRAKGVLPMVVAVGGTRLTNGAGYRGDSSSAWQKIVRDVKPSIIMTNRPNSLSSQFK